MEAKVGEEVLLVSLPYTVTNPRTMMVESADASLALATMLRTQRLIILAFSAIAELDVDTSLGHISLNGRLIFTAVEF